MTPNKSGSPGNKSFFHHTNLGNINNIMRDHSENTPNSDVKDKSFIVSFVLNNIFNDKVDNRSFKWIFFERSEVVFFTIIIISLFGNNVLFHFKKKNSRLTFF